MSTQPNSENGVVVVHPVFANLIAGRKKTKRSSMTQMTRTEGGISPEECQLITLSFPVNVNPELRIHSLETEPNPSSLIEQEFAIDLLGVTAGEFTNYIRSGEIIPVETIACRESHGGTKKIIYKRLFKAEDIYLLRRLINPLSVLDIMTIEEAARVLGKTSRTLRRWCESGRIKPAKVVSFGERGNTVFFDVSDIENLRNDLLMHPERRGRPRIVAPDELDVPTTRRHLSRVTRQ